MLGAFVLHMKMHVPSHMEVVAANQGYLKAVVRRIGPAFSTLDPEPNGKHAAELPTTETDSEANKAIELG